MMQLKDLDGKCKPEARIGEIGQELVEFIAELTGDITTYLVMQSAAKHLACGSNSIVEQCKRDASLRSA